MFIYWHKIKFKEYLHEAERHTGRQLCVLKSDRGGEYRSSQFISFAATHGITLEQGPPHTPEHNSIAERYNRTIMERTRAQMIHASAPNHLWGEFVMATSHILNLSPSTSINDLPIKIWNSGNNSGTHPANVSFLRVLGCRAYTHIPKSQRRKLDPTAFETVHVGYKAGAKAYRLWDPQAGRISISRDVIFDESVFPMRKAPIEQNAQPDDDNDEYDKHATHVIPPPAPDTATLDAPPHPVSESPSGAATTPATHVRPTCNTRPPTRYGNVVSYAAATAHVADPDNPTYSQAMSGLEKDEW